MFVQARCTNIVNPNDSVSKIVEYLSNAGIIQESSQAILNIARTLPVGTVIGKKIVFNNNSETEPFVCLPFFSSHIKVPVKPGEYVWVFPYKNAAQRDSVINGYWLSRVHALKFVEDINYTFNDRDISDKNADNNLFSIKNIYETEKKTKRVENEEHIKKISQHSKAPYTFFDATYEINNLDRHYLKDSLQNNNFRSITPIMGFDDDVILQGSNSTYLKLTSNNSSYGKYSKQKNEKGEIILAAGCGEFAKTNYTLVSGKLISADGGVIYDKSEFVSLIPDADNVAIEFVATNTTENLKDPRAYFFSNIASHKKHLGATKLTEDASKITISESCNYSRDIYEMYNSYLNINNFSLEKISKELESKTTNQKFTVKNFKIQNKPVISLDKKPSINIVSNDINILSRKSDSNITISKQYSLDDKTNLHSQMKIDQSGDIIIDGRRIFIGSSKLEKKKGSYKNGEGSLVILGNSEETQSLVLGEQLKEMIVEMNNVCVESMDSIKKLLIEISAAIASIQSATAQSTLDSANDSTTAVTKNLGKEILTYLTGGASTPATHADLANVLQIVLNTIVETQSISTTKTNVASKQNSKTSSKTQNSVTKAPLLNIESFANRLNEINENIDLILSKTSKTS